MKDFASELSTANTLLREYATIVSYFDDLMVDGAGLVALLRGAAAVSGAVAGTEHRGRTVRVDAAGHRVPENGARQRSPSCVVGDGSVWLERDDEPSTADVMVVDRLAVAVGLLNNRYSLSNALSTAIDPEESGSARSAALIRLGVDPSTRARLIATQVDAPFTHPRTTLVPTRYGMLRAQLAVGVEVGGGQPAGIGRWMRADHAPDSWEEAVIAYRLTDSETPIVDATDFGAMLTLVKHFDPDSPHPDVLALAHLDSRSAQILGTLVVSVSVRAAAAELGIHHSTLQAKHEQLIQQLGYDPRSVTGRMRYTAAESLRRLLPTTIRRQP